MTDGGAARPADGGARAEILRRIRVALADRPRPPDVPRDYRRTLDPDTDGFAASNGLAAGADVLDLFAERAADYRATVHRIGEADLPATIAAVAGDRRIVVPVDIPPEWTAGLVAEVDDPPLSAERLDRAGGVLTGAAVAIALTGTVVLDSGPGQGRRAISLLPDLHLCVIRAEQVVGTVAEALARLDPRRPQTWISGPSATSDIELDRVEGVHGPRDLHLLLVE